MSHYLMAFIISEMAFWAKYSQIVATGGVIGLFGITIIPQTFGLKRYQSVLANYEDGEEQPVAPHITEIVQKVSVKHTIKIK